MAEARPNLDILDDRRLIEDYLPIKAISAEASREKSVRKGHISTLHLWWARRPLVACRAAVYGALVPAAKFRPTNGPEEKRDNLARANAAKFVERLCKYPGDPRVIAEAQQHILEAHADRLSKETGKTATAGDILQGRAPRPKIVDMFAGGGAIPLEALRLGCEVYALDLNPVAYIIELCTLVYPQKFGAPDATAKGSAKDGTWAGLAEEIRFWGQWVLKKAKAEVGDLYPLIPDPKFKGERSASQSSLWHSSSKEGTRPGYLVPVAYLWTRTVRCKNPSCGATVPLVRQTWLTRKSPCAALRRGLDHSRKMITFHLEQAESPEKLSFDPEAGSYRGSTSCPFCGAAIDNAYVMSEGLASRIGRQLICIIARRPDRPGKVYLAVSDYPGPLPMPTDAEVEQNPTFQSLDFGPLDAEIPSDRRESFWCRSYGIRRFRQAFLPRQLLFLGSFVRATRELLRGSPMDVEHQAAVSCYLVCLLDKLVDYNSSLTHWHSLTGAVTATYARQALPMVWDFPEINPFAGALADAKSLLDAICRVVEACPAGHLATVIRSSAITLPFADASIDCIVTDPPYYDNISYAKLSDFFYVWARQVLGDLMPEHFASLGAPKKNEAIVDIARADGNRGIARAEYERLMAAAWHEARRLLKPDGFLVCVYAHKTMAGWASLLESLRSAAFEITEAWPLDTEMKTRVRAAENASLASSIFLAARKRRGGTNGSYEKEVRPELEAIVRERVAALWEQGISGADLIIACVGAGLRAFTHFAQVEYANGEEVPAERFLAEVDGVVLETLLEKIFNVPRSGVAAVDGPSRFYVLWRYAYKVIQLDAGEAIVFTYGQGVELDGPRGLSSGSRALVEKKKGKYSLRDYTERGVDDRLGLPTDDGVPAPLIDVLHRILWLVEHEPRSLTKFLDEARPDRERLRLVAQALAGAGLKGKSEEEAKVLVTTTPSEQAALGKLLANWRALIEAPVMPLYDLKGKA
jgi:putative DNA methylase